LSTPRPRLISPGFGYYGGYSPYYSPAPVYYGGGGGGFGVITSLAVAGAALWALNAATATVTSSFESSEETYNIPFLRDPVSSPLGRGTSVVQLSVALEVPNRDDRDSILSSLDRLARTANTDSRVGIQNLTSQVALELLRKKSSIISATTVSKNFSDRTTAMRNFSQRSVKERAKFERESFSNYGGVDYSTSTIQTAPLSNNPKATMAVVTLLLSIDGDSTGLNHINSVQDLETALRNIASDSKVDDCLQAAEILWTPEDRDETLTSRDVLADYPELRNI